MTVYKWIINSLDCIPKEGAMLDVVIIVNWTRFAEQGNIQASIYGTMKCATPNEKDFISYSDLTFEQVCKWLEAELNVLELDKNLDFQIENIINPPIVTLPLPWVK